MAKDQDTDIRRDQLIQRLTESGCEPREIDQILRLVDAMMTGRAPLAQVLLAAKEVCTMCQLGGTYRHLADALGCLAVEVLQSKDPPESVGAACTRFGMACWNDEQWGRDVKALA